MAGAKCAPPWRFSTTSFAQFRVSQRHPREFRGEPASPPGFKKVEEFTGTKGVLETSRMRLIDHKADAKLETIASKRDITVDAFETFIPAFRPAKAKTWPSKSARSTMIGLLGRAALYKGREKPPWKGEVRLRLGLRLLLWMATAS